MKALLVVIDPLPCRFRCIDVHRRRLLTQKYQVQVSASPKFSAFEEMLSGVFISPIRGRNNRVFGIEFSHSVDWLILAKPASLWLASSVMMSEGAKSWPLNAKTSRRVIVCGWFKGRGLVRKGRLKLPAWWQWKPNTFQTLGLNRCGWNLMTRISAYSTTSTTTNWKKLQRCNLTPCKEGHYDSDRHLRIQNGRWESLRKTHEWVMEKWHARFLLLPRAPASGSGTGDRKEVQTTQTKEVEWRPRSGLNRQPADSQDFRHLSQAASSLAPRLPFFMLLWFCLRVDFSAKG